MPIKTTTAYVDSKGGVHASLREAQVVELRLLANERDTNLIGIADILDNADAVLAILSEHEDLSMVPAAPAPTPQRRLSLAVVLERARQYYDNDAALAEAVASGQVRKCKGIGDTSYELLKSWATARQPHVDGVQVANAIAAEAFAHMRETVNAA